MKDIYSTLNYYWDNNNLIVQLLNSVEKFNSVYSINVVSNWIHWLDVLHRIILTVLIFQVIKAFQKFVAK
jgi:hypothetical protein